MLTKYDDYPVQQTAEPIAFLANSDRNAYGRYWFNGYDPDGEFYFGIAFGIYPNREVMDCALSIVRKDGTQDSFRASRHLTGDRTDTRVGPFTLAIDEPMRRLRITIDKNQTGISADLTFHARSPVHEEPADFARQNVRVVMNATRFTQFGMWGGHITVGERRQEVDLARVYGTRDRSWGWRWTGEPEAGVARVAPSQWFWLWAPIHWQDECTLYGLTEDVDGTRGKQFCHFFPAHAIDSGFDPLDAKTIKHGGAGKHRLTFQPGTRLIKSAEIDAVVDGETRKVTLEPLLTFYMMGIGYFHESWGHGFFKGKEEMVAEHWNVRDIDPLAPAYQHVQQVVRATCEGKTGCGALEQLFFGAHAQYGFKEFLDPAPQPG